MTEVTWSPRARRALRRLPEKVAVAVVEFVYGGLVDNPRRVGKPMRFELEGLFSARRGAYRVIYRIDPAQVGSHVTIIAIDHRADVYRHDAP